MTDKIEVPEEFKKVMKDFISDIRTTFPEYEPLIKKWLKEPSMFENIENDEERKLAFENAENSMMDYLFHFCQKKYPPRFFEILYENDEIFKENSEHDTEFLPNVFFKNIWQFEISDKTRATIWKYLQLILFSIVGTLGNKDAFGDSAKLFEAINEDDFKNKLEETLGQMQNLFNMSDASGSGEEFKNNFNMNDMPDVNELHSHITGMLDGKLGKLAKEIAEETAEQLNIDVENTTDMKDVFNKLIKNPTKLMGLVKNIGNKLDEKLKSGEIKESEIMEEASEMMKKMKNMPGMGNIQSMLSKMGMPGGMGKVNMGAMESQLNRNMKAAKTKERMRAKAEASKAAKEMSSNMNTNSFMENQPKMTEEQIISVFSTGEKVEKTPRGAQPVNKKQKSKNKK
jgi:hypothetical protein